MEGPPRIVTLVILMFIIRTNLILMDMILTDMMILTAAMILMETKILMGRNAIKENSGAHLAVTEKMGETAATERMDVADHLGWMDVLERKGETVVPAPKVVQEEKVIVVPVDPKVLAAQWVN
uniref:Transmembrane protein n=1 Tax=Pithovirus LCPAC201 TaxID=2506591 RepID=A0A481Z7P6_9VIRU|nr:MAG: hypothetical protein LCPAC201_00220 [Pithovirus LCPAC201]